MEAPLMQAVSDLEMASDFLISCYLAKGTLSAGELVTWDSLLSCTKKLTADSEFASRQVDEIETHLLSQIATSREDFPLAEVEPLGDRLKVWREILPDDPPAPPEKVPLSADDFMAVRSAIDYQCELKSLSKEQLTTLIRRRYRVPSRHYLSDEQWIDLAMWLDSEELEF